MSPAAWTASASTHISIQKPTPSTFTRLRSAAQATRRTSCPSPKPRPPAKWLICQSGSGHYLSSMITLLLHLLRLLPFLFGGHRQLAIENLALRHQLSVYKRTTTQPKLRTTDRLFWIGLTRVWAGWRQSLVFVTPDTVLRWQRRRFREYWTQLSALMAGRPLVTVAQEIGWRGVVRERGDDLRREFPSRGCPSSKLIRPASRPSSNVKRQHPRTKLHLAR
jgi:hypothetical protein